MRVAPDGFRPTLRAQWMACVMHDILGLRSLSGAPALFSVYRSIVTHPALGSARGWGEGQGSFVGEGECAPLGPGTLQSSRP
jgi:hypothetical protein